MTSELIGKTVLVTRPREQAAELKRLFEERCATVLLQPAIETLAPEDWSGVDDALRAVRNGGADWIVFSSANGVRFLLNRLDSLWENAPQDVLLDETQEKAFDLARRAFSRSRERTQLDRETSFEEKIAAQNPFFDAKEQKTFDALRRAAFDDARRYADERRENFARFFRDVGVDVAAVGPGTADALREFGVSVDLIPLEFNAEGLVEALERVEKNLTNKRILSVRASRGRDVLTKNLTNLGAVVRDVVAYRSVDVETPDPTVERALFDGKIDYATVASSATVRSLVKTFGAALAQTRWIALSPLTADALREAGLEVAAIAKNATIENLVEAVVELESRTPFDGKRLRGKSDSTTAPSDGDPRAAI